MSIISKLLLLAVAAVGALAALKIIPTKAKKSLPAAIVFALTALLLVISLITSMINMGLFAPNTENDGHKRKDPCVITDGTYNRSYHPCLEDGNEVWFEYVSDPKSDEQKRFYLEGIDSDYTISIYKGKSKDAFATATNDELVANVESGETYIILVELNGYVDYSWKVSVGKPIPKGASKDKAYELTEDGMSYTAFESLEDYTYVWFKFIPKSDGYYRFSPESDSYYSSYYYFNVFDGYDDDGYNDDVYDDKEVYNDYYRLTAGSTYYVYVYDVYEDGFSIDVETLGGTSFENAIEISADDSTYVSSVYGVHSDEMYFEFTPETSGWYSISTNYEYSYYMYLYNEDDTKSYLTSSYNAGVAYNLTANATYYVQLTYYSTDSYFYMYVEPVLAGESKDAAYELTEGENEAQEYESLVDGTTVWFKFTPDTSGYYQIYLTGASADYSYYVYQGTSTSTQSASGVYYYMNSSYTYYVKYYVTDDDSFGVNVEKARGNSMSNGIVLETDVECSTGYNSSVHSSYEMYFEFTPETDGWYTFSLTDANTHYLYLYDDINGSYIKYTSSSTPLSYELEADTTYYLEVYFSGSYDTSYSITAHANVDGEIRENAYELAEGENEAQEYASLVDGTTVWFAFTPDYSGYYQISLTGASADYSYYVYQGTSTSTQSASGVYYYLYSDYTYYIKYSGVTDDDSFGVKIETAKGDSIDNAIVLEADVECTTGYNSSVHSSYEMWFELTPETAGWYTFSLTDAYSHSLYLYDSMYGSSYIAYSSSGTALSYELTADTTYYLRVYFTSSYDASYSITAHANVDGEIRELAYELAEGANEAQDYASLVDGSSVWFEFTPDTTGYYQIYLTGASANHSYYVYQGTSTSTQSSSGVYYYLYSGYTYYINYYSVTDDDSFGVNVEAAKGNSMSNAIVLEEDVPRYTGYYSSIHSSYYMYFEFTPETAGWYTFSLTDAYSHYLYLYDSIGGSYIKYTSSSTPLSYELEADTTYYLRVYFSSSYDSSYSITAHANVDGEIRENAYELTEGENEAQEYESLVDGSSIWFKFVPTTSGYYQLVLTDASADHSYYVYQGTSTSTQSTYSVYYYLSSGYTYYINYYGVTGDDSFGVNIEAAKGTSLSNPIVLEESVERYTGYYSSVHSSYRMYFEFTPETSDSYVFSLRDADGNYLYLYDESGSYLTYTSGTSTLQYELEAGSTYYLMVDFSYSGSYDYYYYVTARPTAKGENRDKAYSLTEGLNEAEEYENLKYNDFVWFEFTPEEDGYYQFANTDASTYYYFYVYEGDSTSYKSSTAGNYYYLTSGYTYYVYYYSVTNDNSFGVMISTNKGSSMTDAIELTEGDLRYVGYNSSYNSGYEMYFEFTPDVTYEYNFYLSNVNSCSLYLYDSTDGDYITYSTYSTSLSYELTAGTTYYLRVYFNSSYDTSYSIKVSQVFRGTSADDAINLVLGASSISTGYDSSYNTNGEIWYKFTSSDADQYALYLSSIYEYHDIYVYDDAEATNRIAGGTSYYGSEYVYVNCEANTTYYVMIDFTSYVDTSFYIQAYQY